MALKGHVFYPKSVSKVKTLNILQKTANFIYLAVLQKC